MAKFGIGQIGNDTPAFAKWIFRVWFFTSKAVVGWLGYTHLVSENILYETLGLVTLLIDPIMYGVSKMFGIDSEDLEK